MDTFINVPFKYHTTQSSESAKNKKILIMKCSLEYLLCRFQNDLNTFIQCKNWYKFT